MRRLLSCLIVFVVAATPAADAFCRAICLTPAAEAADTAAHCAIHQPSPEGPAMTAGGGPCANPHAEARVLQAAIKIERAAFATAAATPAVVSSLPPTDSRPVLARSLARHPRSSSPHRSLPLRC